MLDPRKLKDMDMVQMATDPNCIFDDMLCLVKGAY